MIIEQDGNDAFLRGGSTESTIFLVDLYAHVEADNKT